MIHYKKISSIWIVAFFGLFQSCTKDPTPELPRITNIEIGTLNNKKGIKGRDFHFNADVHADGKIDYIEVKILQKTEATSAKAWNLTIRWDQYKGLKNTNVHEHFLIPSDATEGNYDFVFSVRDQKGAQEVKEDFTIISVQPGG